MKESTLRRIIREEISALMPIVLEAHDNTEISASEVARIMGYKSASMVYKNIDFFRGTKNGRSWAFPLAFIKQLKRNGMRPEPKVVNI